VGTPRRQPWLGWNLRVEWSRFCTRVWLTAGVPQVQASSSLQLDRPQRSAKQGTTKGCQAPRLHRTFSAPQLRHHQ